MLGSINLLAQHTLDNYGFSENLGNDNFRMNSLESNINNYSEIGDWELSLSFKSELDNTSNLNLNTLSVGKNFNNHYLYMRYTPGIFQKYIFNSRTEYIVGDSVQNYKTNLSYSEKYGFGYSYNLSENFSIGASFRYFQQKFNEEYPSFFSNDTANFIQVRDENVNKNYWRGDIGIHYSPFENFSLSLSSINLAILKDFDEENSDSEFNVRTTKYNLGENKGAVLGLNYSPLKSVYFAGRFESTKSFLVGGNYNFEINNSSLTIGAAIYHDNYQEPYLAGIQPSINYSDNLLSLTISYLKYFEDRTQIKSLDDFNNYGIHNIQNNYFSQDRVNLLLNFALSFKKDKLVKFIDVDIKNDIFPTFKENYIDTPFALGKVVNISDKIVSIKPSCYIKDITEEKIFSPAISIQPNDTVDVPFFILISDNRLKIDKTKISQANFYLTVVNEEPDDQFQKPVLIHNQNNWDGNVKNLRYFVNYDIDYSSNYASTILKNIKANRNSNGSFDNLKILFNEFVKNMKYVSDRRATVDYVQFPRETIELKGGDCDDLSVSFSSVLESVGIQTAFIDYKPTDDIGHVTLLINTNLVPSEAKQITINERKYFVRKNYNGKEEIWLPVEITSLTNFEEAWNIGATKFYNEAIDNLGLLKNKVEILDVY